MATESKDSKKMKADMLVNIEKKRKKMGLSNNTPSGNAASQPAPQPSTGGGGRPSARGGFAGKRKPSKAPEVTLR